MSTDMNDIRKDISQVLCNLGMSDYGCILADGTPFTKDDLTDYLSDCFYSYFSGINDYEPLDDILENAKLLSLLWIKPNFNFTDDRLLDYPEDIGPDCELITREMLANELAIKFPYYLPNRKITRFTTDQGLRSAIWNVLTKNVGMGEKGFISINDEQVSLLMIVSRLSDCLRPLLKQGKSNREIDECLEDTLIDLGMSEQGVICKDHYPLQTIINIIMKEILQGP